MVLDDLAVYLGIEQGGAVLIAPACILTSAIIASIIALVTIHTNRSNARKKNSMDFITAYNNSDAVGVAESAIIKHRVEGTSKEYFEGLATATPCKNTQMDAQHIRTVLNYYEGMAVCISYGIYDSKIIKQLVYTTVTDIWNTCSPYVYKRREIKGVNSFYQDIEYLVNVWGGKRPKRSLPFSYRARGAVQAKLDSFREWVKKTYF